MEMYLRDGRLYTTVWRCQACEALIISEDELHEELHSWYIRLPRPLGIDL